MIGHLTTEALAQLLGGEVVGRRDLALGDIAPINDARPGCLTFIRSAEYARRWVESGASAALVTRGLKVPGHDPEARALIVVDNADRALVALLEHLAALAAPPSPPQGSHPTALVDRTAHVDPTACIGPYCVIGAGASIGAGCALHAHVTIGQNARLGDRCTLHPGVVIYPRCVIGDRCTLHASAVIGADGFGYIPHPSGRGLVKVPHLGNVVIGNDVEIGASACIDRGKFRATTVGDGAKIDNLVQVGHNCTIGRNVALCGQVGVGGSCTIEDDAMLGGQAGVRDNVRIGAGALIAGKAGVMEDVPPGESWFGIPARLGRDVFRTINITRRLGRTLAEIKSRLDALEGRARDDRP